MKKKKILISLGIVLLNPLIVCSDTLGTSPQQITTAIGATNMGVEDINEWDVTLNGTIVKITGYLGTCLLYTSDAADDTVPV